MSRELRVTRNQLKRLQRNLGMKEGSKLPRKHQDKPDAAMQRIRALESAISLALTALGTGDADQAVAVLRAAVRLSGAQK